MKKYTPKKLSKEQLRESNGKIRTEEIFLKDLKLAQMFIMYMKSNIKYLKRYEYDPETYNSIANRLDTMKKELKTISKDFKEHNKEVDNGQ